MQKESQSKTDKDISYLSLFNKPRAHGCIGTDAQYLLSLSRTKRSKQNIAAKLHRPSLCASVHLNNTSVLVFLVSPRTRGDICAPYAALGLSAALLP